MVFLKDCFKFSKPHVCHSPLLGKNFLIFPHNYGETNKLI